MGISQSDNYITGPSQGLKIRGGGWEAHSTVVGIICSPDRGDRVNCLAKKSHPHRLATALDSTFNYQMFYDFQTMALAGYNFFTSLTVSKIK